jgi:hypothetical protein
MRYVGPRHIVIDDAPAPVPFWEPDQSFAGQTVVVIGNGPSLLAVEVMAVAGQRLIAVNSACRWAAPIATAEDMLFFVDNSWNENRPELAAAWPGIVVSPNRNAKARLGEALRRIDITELTVWAGAMPDAVQASSGHGAAVLAARMGAVRVVLIGFDGRRVDGRSHWHNDYQEHGDTYNDRFIPGWRMLMPVFTARRVELFNATPGSAIDAVPFRPIAECLE